MSKAFEYLLNNGAKNKGKNLTLLKTIQKKNHLECSIQIRNNLRSILIDSQLLNIHTYNKKVIPNLI